MHFFYHTVLKNLIGWVNKPTAPELNIDEVAREVFQVSEKSREEKNHRRWGGGRVGKGWTGPQPVNTTEGLHSS